MVELKPGEHAHKCPKCGEIWVHDAIKNMRAVVVKHHPNLLKFRYMQNQIEFAGDLTLATLAGLICDEAIDEMEAALPKDEAAFEHSHECPKCGTEQFVTLREGIKYEEINQAGVPSVEGGRQN